MTVLPAFLLADLHLDVLEVAHLPDGAHVVAHRLLGQRDAGGGLEVHLDGVVLDLAVAAERDLDHLQVRGGRRPASPRPASRRTCRRRCCRPPCRGRLRAERARPAARRPSRIAAATVERRRLIAGGGYSRSTIRPSAIRSRRGRLLRQLVVVRDDEDGGAELPIELEEELVDLAPGLGVEVPGRLVGQQEPGPKQQGARQRHPLLLAARKLARPVREPVGQADARQHRRRPLGAEPPRLPQDEPRHHGVLERGELRQQVVELEDEADLPVAELRQPRGVHRRHVDAVEGDRAGRRGVERPQDLEQRRLADPRGADHRGHLAGREVEVEPPQHVDRPAAMLESLRQTAHLHPRPAARVPFERSGRDGRRHGVRQISRRPRRCQRRHRPYFLRLRALAGGCPALIDRRPRPRGAPYSYLRPSTGRIREASIAG